MILVDEWSSINIFYSYTTWALGISNTLCKSYSDVLIGFLEKLVMINGKISLRMMIGITSQIQSINIDFLIVAARNNAYNAILGQMSSNKLIVVVSTLHLLTKFLTQIRVGQVQIY